MNFKRVSDDKTFKWTNYIWHTPRGTQYVIISNDQEAECVIRVTDDFYVGVESGDTFRQF